jgi:hypothetical protein
MPNTARPTALTSADLSLVTGGAGGAPLSGDVRQNIQTNWGGSQTNIGTQVINPAPVAPPPPTTRFEYLRQNPAARFGPPPYKPMPIRH